MKPAQFSVQVHINWITNAQLLERLSRFSDPAPAKSLKEKLLELPSEDLATPDNLEAAIVAALTPLFAAKPKAS